MLEVEATMLSVEQNGMNVMQPLIVLQQRWGARSWLVRTNVEVDYDGGGSHRKSRCV